jgi:hypothetical protein
MFLVYRGSNGPLAPVPHKLFELLNEIGFQPFLSWIKTVIGRSKKNSVVKITLGLMYTETFVSNWEFCAVKIDSIKNSSSNMPEIYSSFSLS